MYYNKVRKMKKLLWLVVLLLVALIMVVTAPSEEKHKAAMMEAVEAMVDEEAAEHGLGDDSFVQFGKSMVSLAVKVGLDLKLQFDNYYIFNRTHVRLGAEDKVLSYGLLGHVFTFDKDKLREYLEEATHPDETVEAGRGE